MRGYSVRNSAPNEADVYIYEEIGFENWDGTGITAKQIAKDLQAAGNLDRINVHINSPGGLVFEAVACMNIFKMHPAHVTVSIEGLAASSASIVAMCGNSIEMCNTSMIMIHKPWTISIGISDDLRKDADMLDNLEKSAIVQAYVNQCNKSGHKNMAGKLAEMMAAETWMNAEQALSYGLIDLISEPLQAAASFDLRKFKYRNAPAASNCLDDMAIRSKIASMGMKCLKFRQSGART